MNLQKSMPVYKTTNSSLSGVVNVISVNKLSTCKLAHWCQPFNENFQLANFIIIPFNANALWEWRRVGQNSQTPK